MNTTRTEELKTLRDDLEQRLRGYEAHQHREDSQQEADASDQAIQRQNDQVVDSLETELRKELEQVVHALDRIDAGEGDTCEQCGNPIDPERLKALPWTSLCVYCAERTG